MAADDKGTDQEPRASRPSDPGAEVANPSDDRSTFIGLGSIPGGVFGQSPEEKGAASSVSSEGADSDEERAKAPRPAPSLESNAVGLEDATSRLEPPSKNEPAAIAEAEPASDRPDAQKAGSDVPETENSASSDGEATEAGTSPASGVASQATSSRGALLLALAGVVLVGAWWVVNRETSPSENLDSATMQQGPVPTGIESTALSAEPKAAEPAAQEQAQPLPQSQPSDDRAAQISTKLAAEVPSSAPVANAPEDNTTGKGASSQLTPRRAALVAIAKKTREMRHCRRKPDPVGTAQALVTFDSSGRVSKARVLSPYAATHTGVCLTERLNQITMDPFSGESVTVQVAIELY